MRVSFIGAGKVGFSLGKFLKSNCVKISGYYSRHIESAREAAVFTESNVYESINELVDESDAIVLTVPDGEIKSVYNKLCKADMSGKMICHCSGAMSVEEAFPDISRYGAKGISIHPLFPVSDRRTTYQKLAGAFFCLEGDINACEKWEKILTRCKTKVRIIDPEDKIRYHAGCVFASNMVCALIQESVEMLTSCGFDEGEALEALKPLAISNIEAVFDKGAVKALTGPVERLDTETVKKHIKCMDEEELKMYTVLTKKLVDIARTKHPDKDYSKMEKML